jgi:hypothetical protein
MGHVMPD